MIEKLHDRKASIICVPIKINEMMFHKQSCK